MPLFIDCPRCGKRLRATFKAVGHVRKCPKCRLPITISAVTVRAARELPKDVPADARSTGRGFPFISDAPVASGRRSHGSLNPLLATLWAGVLAFAVGAAVFVLHDVTRKKPYKCGEALGTFICQNGYGPTDPAAWARAEIHFRRRPDILGDSWGGNIDLCQKFVSVAEFAPTYGPETEERLLGNGSETMSRERTGFSREERTNAMLRMLDGRAYEHMKGVIDVIRRHHATPPRLPERAVEPDSPAP